MAIDYQNLMKQAYPAWKDLYGNTPADAPVVNMQPALSGVPWTGEIPQATTQQNPKDIKEFRASLDKELAIPSDFRVIITPPLSISELMTSGQLAFRCESANLPGRTVATSDLRIYGPTEKFPYQTTYEDITMTFICSGDMAEKTFFDGWLELINPSTKWNFEYKENYVTTIEIDQFDRGINKPYKVELKDAFPVSVNQLDLDWSNNSTYHKLSVTFAYTSWERMAVDPSDVIYKNAGATPNGYNLAAIIQAGALIYNGAKSISKGNPYSILGVAGAATSIIPSIGGIQTLSSIINSQGRGSLDTIMDQTASSVNKSKQTIPSLTKTTI